MSSYSRFITLALVTSLLSFAAFSGTQNDLTCSSNNEVKASPAIEAKLEIVRELKKDVEKKSNELKSIEAEIKGKEFYYDVGRYGSTISSFSLPVIFFGTFALVAVSGNGETGGQIGSAGMKAFLSAVAIFIGTELLESTSEKSLIISKAQRDRILSDLNKAKLKLEGMEAAYLLILEE